MSLAHPLWICKMSLSSSACLCDLHVSRLNLPILSLKQIISIKRTCKEVAGVHSTSSLIPPNPVDFVPCRIWLDAPESVSRGT